MCFLNFPVPPVLVHRNMFPWRAVVCLCCDSQNQKHNEGTINQREEVSLICCLCKTRYTIHKNNSGRHVTFDRTTVRSTCDQSTLIYIHHIHHRMVQIIDYELDWFPPELLSSFSRNWVIVRKMSEELHLFRLSISSSSRDTQWCLFMFVFIWQHTVGQCDQGSHIITCKPA